MKIQAVHSSAAGQPIPMDGAWGASSDAKEASLEANDDLSDSQHENKARWVMWLLVASGSRSADR